MLKIRFIHTGAITAFIGLVFFGLMGSAGAQNVGGVFGPKVAPGSKAIEFRAAIAPQSDGRPSRLTSRFHYQQSVTDNLRLRAVIQGADTNMSNFDFDLVQFEAQYQFLNKERNGFDSAFRLDVLLGKDRPNLVSFNWTNDVPLNEQWFVRAVMLAQVQFGSNRNSGLFLQTRSSLRYKVNSNYNLQVQVFNTYGSTADFPAIRNQNHSVGPAISAKIAEGWSIEASTLLGLTNATSDVDFRVFLSKSF
ncbi:hypothetical protein [Kordiimonas aquimaris]|uniref:hypothetical protein n=1 Tax=Kordiimonas aquimaris TaxID=707591 RepID=UPI0021D2D95A|nr:hypothetical protein [Kordiimonas aquimaris]